MSFHEISEDAEGHHIKRKFLEASITHGGDQWLNQIVVVCTHSQYLVCYDQTVARVGVFGSRFSHEHNLLFFIAQGFAPFDNLGLQVDQLLQQERVA